MNRNSETADLSLRMSCACEDLGFIEKRSSAKIQHLLERKRLDVLESILHRSREFRLAFGPCHSRCDDEKSMTGCRTFSIVES